MQKLEQDTNFPAIYTVSMYFILFEICYSILGGYKSHKASPLALGHIFLQYGFLSD